MYFCNLGTASIQLKFVRYLAVHLRGDVKILTYKPHTNHKKPSVSSHTLAPTTICDLSHSLYWSPLTDLGHISSVTYVCHPLWFVGGHRKEILTFPLMSSHNSSFFTCTIYTSYLNPVPLYVVRTSSILTTSSCCSLSLMTASSKFTPSQKSFWSTTGAACWA